jgi:hypothetical protein
MAPSHEALKAAMSAGLFASAPVDPQSFIAVMDERDRYRDALLLLKSNSTLNEHQTIIINHAFGID